MRVSKRRQITIPRKLRDQLGFGSETEIEFKPTLEGLLISRHGDHAEGVTEDSLVMTDSANIYNKLPDVSHFAVKH